MEIQLKTLKLVTFDKRNIDHVNFLKALINDESILKWFQGITNNLLHNYGDRFFDHSFFVASDEELIGFVNIGAFNAEESSVYLRAAIKNGLRGAGYGKRMLEEVTEYIFTNYLQVEGIRLKIDDKNFASLKTATACGYTWLEKDYYIRYSPYINNTNTKNKSNTLK